MSRRFERRLVTAVVALGLLGSACGAGTSESTVNVKTVATDLTYGIPEPVTPAAPANVNPVPVNPLSVEKSPSAPDVIETPAKGPVSPCPAAPLTAFPDAATTEITNKPKAGDYKWKVVGNQMVPSVGKVVLPPFVTRKVSDVQDTAAGFSFAVSERELVFGSAFTVKTTYEVRRRQVTGSSQEPGVYLTRIERTHSTDSGSNSVFNPSPAVLILPTPVIVGTTIESTGVDAASLEVLRNHGLVTGRKRVDACGEPVDTFFVKAIQEFIGGEGGLTRREFRYGVATTKGGLPIIEHIESPCVDLETPGTCQPDLVTFFMDAHIGQLEPS
ncbi:MAG: hypothetical protein WD646_03940 [Actinomycetota bacterium]